MTVKDVADKLGFTAHALPDGEREITGVYIGDLLSWVMGRAGADEAWITIMSNRNIVAVATLADTACILLAEGVVPDEGVAQLAQDKGINLLTSPYSAYDTALRLRDCL
jgi:predicted transcriptional regulator